MGTKITTKGKAAFVITEDWESVRDYVMDMDNQGYEVHIIFNNKNVEKLLEFPSLIHSANRIHVIN
jgi:hypothetical protein